MREMVKREWQEVRSGESEPLPRAAGVMIVVASAYVPIWLLIAGGAAVGWW